MSKILLFLAVVLASTPLLSVAAVAETNTWSVASPNKQCEISVSLNQGHLNYQASHGGKVVVQKSPLGLRRDDQDFENSLSFEHAGKITSHREKYELLAVAQQFGDSAEVFRRNHSSSGILGRIQNHHFGLRREAIAEQIEIEREPAPFLQGNRYGFGAKKPDHGFVNGEPGIRVDHLVAGLQQRQQGEEYDGLATRHNGNMLRPDSDSTSP